MRIILHYFSLPLYPVSDILQQVISEFFRLQNRYMRYPGLQDVADGLEVAYAEDNNQRTVRSFFLDLLRREHLPPFEIMTDLIVDQNRDRQIRLFGKPDIGAALQNGIQILRDGFEAGFQQADVPDIV